MGKFYVYLTEQVQTECILVDYPRPQAESH